ncbi:TrkH family potassium uptake protein [Pannonibacter sp. SL95]|uniref:TrkH family potassium uptake protein n=1 Tax=Pannonibacter sp. SL95 TaxID=2995153 RepID=UPI0022762D95|nr:TrkH family potassium uptake protein [Pannonibacter sp. SL95]MCY1705815.1 TrkH family potassium uptake protein [Pannonibacter sp. SL95]
MIALRPILYVLGILYVGLATVMLVPAMVDVATKNADWQAFVFSAFLTGLVGMLLAIAVDGSLKKGLSMRQTFLLTVLAWITIPGFGALPFFWLGLGPADAVFESVSGFTTTGGTVLTGLDSLPPGILVWRSMMQWTGGIGIAVMGIFLLPFLRVGGMQLFQSESGEGGDKIVSRSVELIRLMWVVYGGLTLACAAGYLATGMDAFDAVNHAMATLSTGGFSTHDESFGAFTAKGPAWVAILFMLAGALPFVLVIQAVRGAPFQLWQDPQVRALFAIIGFITFCLTVYLGATQDLGFFDALRLAAFTVVSLITTTGFYMVDYTVWGTVVVGMVLMLAFVGGCTGSTSGGVKIFRYLVLLAAVRSHLRRMVRPNRVTSETFGKARLTPDLSSAVLVYLVLYIGSVAMVSIGLAAFDIDFITCLSAAASAIGNIGTALGPLVGPDGTFGALPDGAKWLLAAAMLLGRLELIVVLVMIDPDFWSN